MRHNCLTLQCQSMQPGEALSDNQTSPLCSYRSSLDFLSRSHLCKLVSTTTRTPFFRDFVSLLFPRCLRQHSIQTPYEKTVLHQRIVIMTARHQIAERILIRISRGGISIRPSCLLFYERNSVLEHMRYMLVHFPLRERVRMRVDSFCR